MYKLNSCFEKWISREQEFESESHSNSNLTNLLNLFFKKMHNYTLWYDCNDTISMSLNYQLEIIGKSQHP